jgi:hypothetical protein
MTRTVFHQQRIATEKPTSQELFPRSPFMPDFRNADPRGRSSSKGSLANNCGEWFKRVSLSRRPCRTGKGARVAL